MRSEVIELDDSETGIDRQQLKRVEQRFLTLNRERHRRMIEGLSERQGVFVELLPLLFHVNHPMLPGYISASVPCGLCHYEPGRQELRLARSLARSFHYQRDVAHRHLAIDALFVMGSVGTIAQSEGSDLDIWVCHGPELDPRGRELLLKKCRELTRWAEQQLRLEAHFFLMEPGQFRSGQLGELSTEGSGTAQRFLLLDEFYRTALWLGGKRPLWWFVPAGAETHYNRYTETLLHQRFLPADQVIDFGGLPDFPIGEFIGAGIWHLYKGIEAPHKSILKLMLLEAYRRGEDRTPLALIFKDAVYQSSPEPDNLDPYVMIYRRLERYLTGETPEGVTLGAAGERLELARRCLYFKVDKALTRPPRGPSRSWQRALLEQLVAEWQWSTAELQRLDRRRAWKAPDVLQERSQLVAELSASYRLINALSKESADTRINHDELMVLGRKLHAAFERKAGKIEWVNPNISRDLSEPALRFVEDPDPAAGAHFWEVFRSRDNRPEGAPLKRARSLGELVLWCYGNGVLTAGTWFELDSDRLSLSAVQRQQLWQLLRQWLPLPRASLAHEPFHRSARAERLLLLFNLGVEPQQGLRERGLHMLSGQSDALDFSGLRDNLVRSVDLVQINSWQEVLCRHYDQEPLVNALQYYLRLVPPGRGLNPPELTIRCLSSQGNLVVQRLEELWRDLIGCYYSGTRPPSTRYVVETAGAFIVIQFLQLQPQVSCFNSYEALLEKLSSAQLEYSPIVVDRHALNQHPLKLMAQHVAQPGVYLFYRVQGEQAEVTLIDEQGSLLVTSMSFHSHSTLLRPLHYFLRSVLERQNSSPDRRPDEAEEPEVALYEICGPVEQGRGYLKARAGAGDISQVSFVSIQVIAEPDLDGQIRYTIYCNDREFSELDWEEDLFAEVADYILAQRRSGERYPCYITDLDLTECRDLLAPQLGLQLSHYLELKADLERRLNRALAAL